MRLFLFGPEGCLQLGDSLRLPDSLWLESLERLRKQLSELPQLLEQQEWKQESERWRRWLEQERERWRRWLQEHRRFLEEELPRHQRQQELREHQRRLERERRALERQLRELERELERLRRRLEYLRRAPLEL
jgi:predicted ribosome quality control (RQC) complex YloA/Tae2 family protein